ncbi:hypothetical protein [Kitasatospora sp. LaBMicrA B282]|uniref:hypothetical protein n=1 Tax=Kitasatospora sp. LaBMicrA B282 TaxID=3420949 RepID=UPI003D0BC917
MNPKTTGALLASLGAALLLGPAPAAVAAPGALHLQPTDATAAANSIGYLTGPVKDLTVYPYGGTGFDPLSNGVAVKPDNPGSRPIKSTSLTDKLSSTGDAKDLPGVGLLLHALPG